LYNTKNLNLLWRKIIKLRPAQQIYAKIYRDNVLNATVPTRSQMELPCNFGKTELIVNYNVPEVLKKYKNQKTIHFCTTIMASPYDTFISRLPPKEKEEFPYGENVWINRSDVDLNYLLDNSSSVLAKYNHIVIFTTLNKMFGQSSKSKFDDLMIKGKEKGFMWCLDRDEGDYAGFDSAEQQAFESGASTELGGSLYAINLIDMFDKYKDNCIYFLAVSGTTLNAHNSEAQLLREAGNPIALTQEETINVDEHGIVTDELKKYVSDESLWKRLVSEDEFYEMKHLNVEFNSWFAEPKLYHKRDWEVCVKDSIQWRIDKQETINKRKSWLINNVSKFYPNVDKNKFSTIFDDHQKINLIQNGKEGKYKTKSFITPNELMNELEKYDNINPIFLHSTPEKVKGAILSIHKEEIKNKKIDTIGVCNLITRGYDIPYIQSIVMLATSPKMNKKSISAPYTKRQTQTAGRGARFGSGIKDCGGLSDIKNLLLNLGIDYTDDNEFNHKFREFLIENLEVKVWLLYDDGVDTATYISEKIKRYYISFTEMKNTIDVILGDKTDEHICPVCKRPFGKKITHIDDDCTDIDKTLGIYDKPTLLSKIKKIWSYIW